MSRYFGTDGIRAEVGSEAILPTVVVRLGWAFGMALNERGADGPVLIAKDTRLSGYMLESALESGLSAAGRDIKLLGPLPTPGTALLVQQAQAAGAIIISASHNPHNHNGLKFFGRDGHKLDESFQDEVEAWMGKDFYCPDAGKLGRAGRIVDAAERYVDHLISAQARVFNLSRMRLVFDGANGAAYRVGPQLLNRLKAKVHTVSCRPNGLNINHKCGSTSIKHLCRSVKRHNADYGIATDGDADRLFMVDGNGQIYDGDRLLYALFASLEARGEMKGGVVGTVQSNQGLEQAIIAAGYPFERSQVGDRHVCERLRQRGWLIGGEPSGHLVHMGMSSCSDGLLIAVHLLGFLDETCQSLAEITEPLTIMPSERINVEARWRGSEDDLRSQPELAALLNGSEVDNCRIVVRPSGTEDVVRILVEGANGQDNRRIADEIASIVSALVQSPANS